MLSSQRRFISREPRPDYVRRAALAYACTQARAGARAGSGCGASDFVEMGFIGSRASDFGFRM